MKMKHVHIKIADRKSIKFPQAAVKLLIFAPIKGPLQNIHTNKYTDTCI